MITNCPGAERFKQPVPENVTCPRCRKELEIWSDEFEVKWPVCNINVKKGASQQSCLDWCKSANICVGPEIYGKYMKAKKKDPVDTA